MEKDFSDWLNKELKNREWSQADLSGAAGINRQVISTYINRQRRNPDPNVLAAIARAFNYPPDIVFRAAGLLPEASPNTEAQEQLKYLFDQLPEDQQKMLVEYAKFLLTQVD